MCILLPFNPQPDAGPKLGWKKYIYIGRASSGRASGLKTFAKKKSCERDGTNQKSRQLLETVLYVPTMVLCGFGPQHDSGMGAFVYFIILTSHLYPSSPFVRTTLPFDVTWQSRSRNCHLGFSHMWEVNDLQPQSINSVLPVQVLNPFSLLLLRSTDKQNELELPCPVPKSRERKRRQGQQPQQQQGGGVMTQIGGVKKGTNNRFGVKTDQEELLSKVRGHSINRGIFFFKWISWADMRYKLLSTMLSLNQDLEGINKWGLNIFRVAEHSHNRPLTCIMYAIFQVSVMLESRRIIVCGGSKKKTFAFMENNDQRFCLCTFFFPDILRTKPLLLVWYHLFHN